MEHALHAVHAAARDRLLAAVAVDGLALQSASETLRGDREVVLAAVAQNGYALAFASAALRRQGPELRAEVARRAGKLDAAASASVSADAGAVEQAMAEPAPVLGRGGARSLRGIADAIDVMDEAAADPEGVIAEPASMLERARLSAHRAAAGRASAVELGGKIQDAAEALTPAGRLDSERLDSADLDAADLDSLESRTVRALPGRLSALSVPQRFPMKTNFVWHVCTGAQGAYTPKTPVSGPGSDAGSAAAKASGGDGGSEAAAGAGR